MKVVTRNPGSPTLVARKCSCPRGKWCPVVRKAPLGGPQAQQVRKGRGELYLK